MVGRVLRNELRRMLRGTGLKAALLLGCGIAVWHFWQNVYRWDMMDINMPETAYAKWIGAGAYAMQSYWYYMVFPLIAVLPYAGAFYDDLKSGYIKSLLLRCGRKTYFPARGAAVFLSGGISVVLPLVLNFALTAAYRPAVGPFPYIGIGPASYCIGSDFYYSHPLAYIGIYLVFDFVAGGAVALSSALLGYWAGHRAAALLTPYGVYYLLFSIGNIVDSIVFSPNYFLIPGMGVQKISSVLLVVASALLCALGFWKKGALYEV